MGFQVERLYYTLNEVADRWNLQADDLLHMAVQEKLRLSFWIEPRIISAYKENEDGKNEKVVTFLSGYALIQIYPRHAHDILASNRAEIINATSTDSEIIRMCGGEYLTLRLDIDLSRNRIGQDSSDEFDDLWRDVCGEDGIYISVQE